MSLDQAAGLSGQDITVLMHYPPLFADGVGTPFTDILEEYAVTRVVYGHLHGAGIKVAFRGERQGPVFSDFMRCIGLLSVANRRRKPNLNFTK